MLFTIPDKYVQFSKMLLSMKLIFFFFFFLFTKVDQSPAHFHWNTDIPSVHIKGQIIHIKQIKEKYKLNRRVYSMRSIRFMETSFQLQTRNYSVWCVNCRHTNFFYLYRAIFDSILSQFISLCQWKRTHFTKRKIELPWWLKRMSANWVYSKKSASFWTNGIWNHRKKNFLFCMAYRNSCSISVVFVSWAVVLSICTHNSAILWSLTICQW